MGNASAGVRRLLVVPRRVRGGERGTRADGSARLVERRRRRSRRSSSSSTETTKPGAPGASGFIPPEQRIATFDNDGTLWAEQPIYFQFAFAHRSRQGDGAAASRSGRTQEPFKSLLAGDVKAALAAGRQRRPRDHDGHARRHDDRRVQRGRRGLARDGEAPDASRRPYTELVYQPMLELLAYLRANGFKTFIVSGGGVEFMRVFAEKVYGIPPEQVVGSSGETQVRDARRQARCW